MSEQEQEPDQGDGTEQTDTPAPDDGDAAAADDEERDAGEQGEQDTGEQGESAEAAQEPAALTEKEIEARIRKLDKLRETTASRVSDILGEDAIAYIPCPLCADGVPAFVPDVAGGAVPADVFAQVQRYLGLPDPETFAGHPNYRRCEACKGRGEVITGSTVPNYMLTGCPECGTKGYIVEGQLPVPGAANGSSDAAPAPVTATAPPDNLPPEAQRLKELGYMIVPPIQPISGFS